MTPHPAALEAYNRATFDPQTPELELAPAETLQVERPTPRNVIASIPVREISAAFAIAGVLWFVAAATSVALS